MPLFQMFAYFHVHFSLYRYPLLFFSALIYHHVFLIPVIRGRELEDAFNSCWSALAEPGAWLSYDEQMVKSTARSMFSLMRFNKCKPIKHGELNLEVSVYSNISIGFSRAVLCSRRRG